MNDLRCKHSGNPCGTDTWVIGSPCQCLPCRQWLGAFRQGQLSERRRLGQTPEGLDLLQRPGTWTHDPTNDEAGET